MTVSEWVERWAQDAPLLPTDVLRELLDHPEDEGESEEP
jgi:hypothetical protein